MWSLFQLRPSSLVELRRDRQAIEKVSKVQGHCPCNLLISEGVMEKVNRRSFLNKSIAVLTGSGVAYYGSGQSQVLGANNDVRVAVTGVGGQGRHHIANYLKMPGVRIVALCDVNTEHMANAVAGLKENGVSVKTYRDFRKMMEDKEIDAVSIATPNHWHSLQGIWACQAGKHCTVEKPVSHNILEGRQLVKASRKYGVMCQGDFDIRSREGTRQAIKDIHSGEFGKIKVARGYIYKRRTSIGKVAGPSRIPTEVDYNLWSGPAELTPLMRGRLDYVWHWVWPTGCGELGNNGPHQLDVCRWALGRKGLPKRVMSIGGRFGYDDDGTTPNTQFAYYDYGDGDSIIYEFRGLGDDPIKKNDHTFESPSTAKMEQFEGVARNGVRLVTGYKGTGVNSGILIECEKGYISINDLKAYDYDGNVIKQWENTGDDPQGAFIKAVRSGKRSDLRNDILDGHLSTALSHMGNISYRVGQQSSPEEIREAIKDNDDLQEIYERLQKHLAKHNLSLNESQATIGPMLHFDSDKEEFTGDWSYEANMFLSRNYRKPFVVPENV
jgi:predicted dehydrogenase